MILLIDNYDSFSYNVFQLVGSVNPDIRVIRNDECSVDEIRAMNPSHIILSPGPGRPDKAGVCENVIRELGGRIPILGICLGHQAICEVAGATVTYASHLMHGKQSLATLDTDSVLFRGMKKVITVARYHSLVADPQTIPAELKVTAVTEDGEVMAVEQTEKQIYGVQFHPESVLTPDGRQIIVNFLQTRKGEGRNMIKEAVAKLVKNENIGYDMAKTVMDEIMSGEASDILKSAYLTALSQKGETIEEITGSAEEMRKFGRKLGADVEALEIVGTGGDGSNSFNISTTASIVISAAGVPVAKHGQIRCGRLPGSTGGEYHHRAGAEQEAVRRDRHLLPLCTEISHCHEICGSHPQGTGHPYNFQYLRTVSEPGRTGISDHGCVR